MALRDASTCLDERAVVAFVGGAISDPALVGVEAHLVSCARCRGLVTDAAREPAASDEAPVGSASGTLYDESPDVPEAGPPSSTSDLSATLLASPGDVVASKYRIEKLLGRGGMGDVFSAVHLELGHRVAIKVLRQAEPLSSARFLREAQIVARLVGDHVPRVFDLGRLASGAPYIVMEFLDGEDLAQVIRGGPVASSDAASYILQACAALREAHAAGIVHRDLKPANLFLTKRSDGSRVLKVLDFGISKLTPNPDAPPSQTLTSTGTVLGSPLYMSPEQVRANKDVDALTDIWSLGVILYELLTGHPPFRGASLPAISVAIATETPPRPSLIRPGVPPGLELVVWRCLEKERASRVASIDLLAQAIAPFASSVRDPYAADDDSEPAPASGVSSSRRARGGRSRLGGLLVVAALAVLAVGGGLYRARRPSAAIVAAPAGASVRRSVAVFGLRNTAGRSTEAWLGTALSDLLRTELASGDELRTLSPERVATAKRDLDLGESDSLERLILGRIHEMLDADIVLVGSYWRLEESDELRIDAVLQDARSGETLASVAEHGPRNDLFSIVSRAGERLRKKLGAEALSATQIAQVRRTLPADPEAARWYAEGCARFDGKDVLAATEAFAKALEREPKFSLAHARLSDAWATLGYESKSDAEAQKALALAVDIPRKERLFLEGNAYLRTAQSAKAVEIFRSLFMVYQDDVDVGLALIDAQLAADQRTEAGQIVAQLRKLGTDAANDPRIDIAESWTVNGVDEVRWANAAHRAFEKAEQRGMRSIQAQARYLEGRGLLYQGRHAEAKVLLLDARKRFADLRDRDGVGRALIELGLLETEGTSGNLDEAKRSLGEASAIFEEIGCRQQAGWARMTLACILAEDGSLKAAATEFHRLLELFPALGSKNLQTAYVVVGNNLAEALISLGELAEAEALLADKVSLAKKMGNNRFESYGLRNLGWLSIAMGRLDESRADFDADLKVCTDASYTAGIVGARIGLAFVSRFSAQPSAAREMLAQAREAARKMQSSGDLEEISLLEMSLDLDESQPARALARRSEWTSLLGTPRRIPAQVQAHSRLALALLADGRLGEATREAQEGSRLARDVEDVQAKADALLADAKVRAAAGDTKGALVALRDLLLLSRRAGRPFELEARLAIGELEKGQHTPGWQGRLEAMAVSAKKEHFDLLARRATGLLASPN